VVKDFGLKFTEKGWPDWWYFGEERRLVKDDDVDDEVDKVRGLAAWCRSVCRGVVAEGGGMDDGVDRASSSQPGGLVASALVDGLQRRGSGCPLR
jgi:hypothetical protein